jgi:site-specific DNA-methyltransferase (adenine-specific)
MNWTDKITITNEDNMELMKRYPDNYFDLAIVDPPYGFGNNKVVKVSKNDKIYSDLESKKWDAKKPSKEYFEELFRVSKNQIIWGGNYFCEIWNEGMNRGFIFWDKVQCSDNHADGELAWTSFDRNAKMFSFCWSGNRYGFKGKIKGVGKPSKRIHATEKPMELYEWLLMNYTKEGDKILDTHLGSGSIAIACHNLGFELTACELDKDYYEASHKRFKEITSQQSLF